MDFITAFHPLSQWIIITSLICLTAFIFYHLLLPKPILGIPFNAEATRTVFGDIPSIYAHARLGTTIPNWMLQNYDRHNSPVVQISTNHFGKPSISINDCREAQVRKFQANHISHSLMLGHPDEKDSGIRQTRSS
jgi:hypothetical protein